MTVDESKNRLLQSLPQELRDQIDLKRSDADKIVLAPSFSVPGLPGPKEHWEMIRRAIEHEDNLTNHRLIWLLTAQGFLLGGFFFAQNAIVNLKTPATQWKYELILSIIFLGAIRLCMIVGTGIALASEHIARVSRWWMRTYPTEVESRICLAGSPSIQPPSEQGWLGMLNSLAEWLMKNRLGFWCLWWFMKSPPLDERTSANPQCNKGEETKQPPICGDFIVPRMLSIRWIPAIFVFINGALCLYCFFSTISYLGTGSPARPPWFVDSVKYTKDAASKETVEILVKLDDAAHDGKVDSQHLYNRLVSALQANTSAKASPWRSGTIKAGTDEPGRKAIEFTITWDDRDGSAPVDLGKLLDEVRQAIATNRPQGAGIPVANPRAAGTPPAANPSNPGPPGGSFPAAQPATKSATATQKKSP